MDDSLEHCLITSREKTYEKKFWDPKLGQKLSFLPFSQDCSFGQCLTPIRVEISKKKICGPNWGQSDLFYSNFVERSLKLACFITRKYYDTKPKVLCYKTSKSYIK